MIDLPPTDLAALAGVASCAVVAVSRDRARQLVPIGTATEDTRFRIASLTKTMTATATVLACRHAGASLETQVLDVLPELRDDWAADPHLTIADVLGQVSGLSSAVTADDVRRLGDDDGVAIRTARLVARAGSVRPRGEWWEYNNANYFLAGALVAALMGATYEDALARLVLRPLDLTSTSFHAGRDLAPGRDQGRPIASSAYPRGRRPSGGLCSSAPDLLTFGESILSDPALLAELASARTRPEDATQYGLGWATGPSGQMYVNGRLPGYRAAFVLVPDHALVGVALAAETSALPSLAQVLSAVQQELTGDDLTRAIDDFAA